jgi:GDP-L-fucose synthase
VIEKKEKRYNRWYKTENREVSFYLEELEPTNEAYAIAKIAGVKMCEFYNKQFHTNFISAKTLESL